MKKREDFKYHAKFEGVATFARGKWKEAKANVGVFADLTDLRSLLPSDEEIGENPDLLYVSFNAAVANIINLNDHGIMTDAALACAKWFVQRQMNLEHDRYEIVGHIISQGFTTFGDNKIVTAEALKGTDQPFNIALGAVVYRVARGYIAEILEESGNPQSCFYQEISTSWEIGFDEFDIALGSKKLSDATIITDEEEKAKYIPFLRMEGGSGLTEDGVPVYCVIKGDCRPLGCAFTSNPAAPVKGLCVAATEVGELLAAEPDPRIDEALNKIDALSNEVKAANEELLKKIELNNSQPTKTTVITNSMKIKRIEDITPELFAKEETASVMKDFISDALAESASEAMQKVKKAEDARVEAERVLAEAQATLAAVQAEVETLKAANLQRELQDEFDGRMEEVASEFNLTAEQTAAVASQIKSLDAAAFAAWKANFGLFATKKTAQASTTTEKTEAEVEAERLAALRAAKPSEATAALPNSQSPANETVDYNSILKGAVNLK